MVEINKYIYYLNYTVDLKDLCNLEMKSLFGFIPDSKTFISSNCINPSRSIFIKSCIVISHFENNLDSLYNSVKADQLFYNDYKISFIKSDDNDILYKERLAALRLIGFAIEGEFALQNPKVSFAITKFKDQWIFGQYIENDHSWIERKQKPFNYSYALEQKIAKTLINIAIGNNFNLKVVDPCCGIGTVIIEGRKMGVNIKGFDLNSNIVEKCNTNLKYFGFYNDVLCMNILDITDFYDVAIVDLPYGLLSKTSLIEQIQIINKTKDIVRKVIFVSMVSLDSILISNGFTIIDSCIVKKSENFKRHITVCINKSLKQIDNTYNS